MDAGGRVEADARSQRHLGAGLEPMHAAPATGREMCLGRLGTQQHRAVHQLAPLLGEALLQNLKYLEAKIWMNHGRRRMGMEGRAARIAKGRSRLLGFGGKGILFF